MRILAKRGVVLGAVAALSISVMGGAAVAQEEQVLRILSNADIRTADPHVAYETETWPTSALFYVGLVRWSDDNSEIIPALAEDYSISDDGLVYTFTLREGLLFSDGSDLTTEDVKYSFERMFRPETLSPTSYMFEAIVGVPEFVDGSADEISGIEIVDERTITFTLQFPVWSLIQRFALPPGFIVPPEAVEASADGTLTRSPLGAGPYILESWESGVAIRGVRNPNYYEEGRPFFDRFEMQLGVEPSVGILRIEGGEADIALDFVPNADYPRLVADPVLSERLVQIAGFPNIDYLVLNNMIEPYSNPDVRHALSLAIDRERLVQILNGRSVPASGPIPPSVLGNNAEIEADAYDPDAARELLAGAGLESGFTIELLTNTDPTNLSIAQALIADWSAVGATVNITSVDNSVFLDTLINQPDTLQVALTNWYLDYPDPSNIYEPLLQCGGSYNWGQVCDEALDSQFAEANAIPPSDDRWAAFSDFEAVLAEQRPNIFLEHQLNFYFTSERINIQSDPAMVIRWDTATLR